MLTLHVTFIIGNITLYYTFFLQLIDIIIRSALKYKTIDRGLNFKCEC